MSKEKAIEILKYLSDSFIFWLDDKYIDSEEREYWTENYEACRLAIEALKVKYE